MTNKLRVLVSGVAVASVLAFTGCGDKKEEQKSGEAAKAVSGEYVLKFSHVVSPNTPKGKAADFFEKRLEEISGGRIDVQVYPSSQLYNDSDALKALKLFFARLSSSRHVAKTLQIIKIVNSLSLEPVKEDSVNYSR